MKTLKKSLLCKVLAIILLLVFAFSLTACGGKGGGVVPEVKNVKIEAMQNATYGRVWDLHKLSYEVGEGCSISVSVTKDGVTATADDYAYTMSSKTLVFKEAGAYTVTVYAAKDGMRGSGSADISVSAYEAPVLSVSGKNTAAEEEAVLIARSVTYASGDYAAEERVTSVEYKATEGGEYAVADAELYSMEEDLFIPHDIGYFRINYEAAGIRGGRDNASFELEVTPAKLTVQSESEFVCIPVGVDTRLNYTVKGPTEKYDMSVQTDSDKVVASADGGGVKVKMDETDYASLTVTYTHKKVNSQKYTLKFYTHASENPVEDAKAPFMGDPFGNMPDTLLTSMGYLLNTDTVLSVVDGARIASRNISYEVVENNVNTSGVEILYAANDENYPYVIVSNFDNNTATGNFTLKMTATDPNTGKSASLIKKFNVAATTNNNDTAKKRICDYVKEHSDYYDLGAMDLSGLVSDTRQNMVLTENGVIMQRTNPSWPLQSEGHTSQNADFAYIKAATPSNDCAMEFKMTVLGTNGGKVKLGIGIRTNNFDGWVGFLNIENSNGMMSANLDSSISKSSFTGAESGADAIPAQAGTVMYFRLERTTSGSTATYTLFVKTVETDAYAKMCTFTAATSANTGKALAAYQFTHRDAGGCYMLENLTIS